MSMRIFAAFSICLCSFALPRVGHAWGAEGHRMTGYIASAQLSDRTRSEVRKLVGTDDLSSLANFMDQHATELTQQYPNSKQWHYNNRPVCETTDSYPEYCPDGDCATKQIYLWRKTLADDHSMLADRITAVRLLVHMIGDIHQPLHIADNDDRGGNGVWVLAPGQTENLKLHAFWDTTLPRLLRGTSSVQTFAALLNQQFASSKLSWQKGTVRAWSEESAKIAKDQVYAPLSGFSCGWEDPGTITLDQHYLDTAQSIVPEQLAKTGYRIAYVLNKAFDPGWRP